MKWRLLLILPITLASIQLLCAEDVPKDFKERIEARYKGQKVKIVVPKIIVGLYEIHGFWPTDADFNVHYDHFYPTVEMSGRYQKRNNFDERTTEEVKGEAEAIDEMSAGETLEVARIATFKRGQNLYLVDLMLRAIAGKRLTTRLAQSPAGYVHREKLTYGVHFRFIYPLEVAQRGDYDAVVHEINPYLLPERDYRESLEAAAKALEASKHVELQPGMSKDEVLKALGNPQKSVVFGKKTILKYPEITVELEEDKVVDVKTN